MLNWKADFTKDWITINDEKSQPPWLQRTITYAICFTEVHAYFNKVCGFWLTFFFEKSTCKWPSEVNGDVYFEKTTWILIFGGVQNNFFSFSFPQTFWSTPYEIYEYMKATRKREEFFGSTSASSNVPFERHKERLRGKYRGEDGGGWQCISQPLCYRKGFHMSPRKSCFLL